MLNPIENIIGTYNSRLGLVKEIIGEHGHHFITDGQFGSTGKGVIASFYAQHMSPRTISACNAGPNSGHTSYTNGGNKVVLKQLPSFGVLKELNTGAKGTIHLTAGAIINLEILRKEAEMVPNSMIVVHPNATIIGDNDILAEHGGSISEVAGTRQGVGAALARKILRDPMATFKSWWTSAASENYFVNENVTMASLEPSYRGLPFLHEVSQGFSLGINSQFYPKTTSRECTAMQAMADARIHPSLYASNTMVIRTYPIRVGNFEGHSSGDCYPDQYETGWDALGLPEEYTTVTGRVRRVFTFSKRQFAEAYSANRPDIVFINFMNYLSEADAITLVDTVQHTAREISGNFPVILLGYGPTWMDIR